MKRLMANKFDFNDFLTQYKTMNNMGGAQMMKLLPGFSKVRAVSVCLRSTRTAGWLHRTCMLQRVRGCWRLPLPAALLRSTRRGSQLPPHPERTHWHAPCTPADQ